MLDDHSPRLRKRRQGFIFLIVSPATLSRIGVFLHCLAVDVVRAGLSLPKETPVRFNLDDHGGEAAHRNPRARVPHEPL